MTYYIADEVNGIFSKSVEFLADAKKLFREEVENHIPACIEDIRFKLDEQETEMSETDILEKATRKAENFLYIVEKDDNGNETIID